MVTVIISLLVIPVDVYVVPVSQLIAFPPLFHWYVGPPPPLVGVAVNVTLVPEQNELSTSLDAMATLGVTVVVIVADPVASVWVVAFVDVQLTFPLAPLEALVVVLT